MKSAEFHPDAAEEARAVPPIMWTFGSGSAPTSRLSWKRHCYGYATTRCCTHRSLGRFASALSSGSRIRSFTRIRPIESGWQRSATTVVALGIGHDAARIERGRAEQSAGAIRRIWSLPRKACSLGALSFGWPTLWLCDSMV